MYWLSGQRFREPCVIYEAVIFVHDTSALDLVDGIVEKKKQVNYAPGTRMFRNHVFMFDMTKCGFGMFIANGARVLACFRNSSKYYLFEREWRYV